LIIPPRGSTNMSDIINIPLFPVNLFKIRMRNHKKIKNYIVNTVVPNFEKHGPNDKNSKAYTDYVPGAIDAPWKILSTFYDEDIQDFLKKTGVNFDKGWTYKVTCWYGLMTNSTTQFVHDHIGGPTTIQWSGVHYVVLDEKSSGTIFLNPNSKLMKAVMPTKNYNEIPEIYFPVEQGVIVEEGDMVFFPSWLEHHTPSHTTDSLRAVVALNIMLRYDNKDGY